MSSSRKRSRELLRAAGLAERAPSLPSIRERHDEGASTPDPGLAAASPFALPAAQQLQWPGRGSPTSRSSPSSSAAAAAAAAAGGPRSGAQQHGSPGSAVGGSAADPQALAARVAQLPDHLKLLSRIWGEHDGQESLGQACTGWHMCMACQSAASSQVCNYACCATGKD